MKSKPQKFPLTFPGTFSSSIFVEHTNTIFMIEKERKERRKKEKYDIPDGPDGYVFEIRETADDER